MNTRRKRNKTRITYQGIGISLFYFMKNNCNVNCKNKSKIIVYNEQMYNL